MAELCRPLSEAGAGGTDEFDRHSIHQLAASPAAMHAFLEQGILHALPSHLRPETLVLWPYAQFPFGTSLDYLRKFCHYVDAGQDPAANGVEPSKREYALCPPQQRTAL